MAGGVLLDLDSLESVQRCADVCMADEELDAAMGFVFAQPRVAAECCRRCRIDPVAVAFTSGVGQPKRGKPQLTIPAPIERVAPVVGHREIMYQRLKGHFGFNGD